MYKILFAACLIVRPSWLSAPAALFAQDAPLAGAVEPAVVEGGEVEIAKVELAEPAVEQAVADFAIADAELQNPQMRIARSYARVNAALARRCCQLSQAEEAQLALMDDPWLARQIRDAHNSPLKNVAAGIARFLQGQIVQRANHRPENQRAVLDRVKQAIDAHIHQALTEEHRAQFRSECESRQKFRTESLTRIVVAAFDSRIYLTAEQRQQLETEVAAWMKADLYWQFYFQNQNIIPGIPRSVLSKVLTDAQLASLQGTHAMVYEVEQAELNMVQEDPLLIEH